MLDIEDMPYRKIAFANNGYYHIFNRGVAKQAIFSNSDDYNRLLDVFYYYQFSDPKPSFSWNYHHRFKKTNFMQNPKIVTIIAYCLMPNHFHILARQEAYEGVQTFIRKALNSYTKYFNTKYERVGPILQGEFKAVPITTDEQLLHVSRYIHLNPYVSGIASDLEQYSFSSYHEYIGKRKPLLANPEPILSSFKDLHAYKAFVNDQKTYGIELEMLKHTT